MNLLLILTVGPILAGGPPLLAVWLCERHANRYGQTHAAHAQRAVEAAEARRAANRPKESIR